ncbi:hypothetical protein [Belnapia rosea]|uniref:Uncharacterized protein n=1 Tax=Belnapia rosea TaxID=938405 RepID=A0A1G6MA64_9PROT|nr:hypothetical protein [Belnapia rosea]SDC52472.1 hypothetical protein SAMN04487779_10011150 [Belnapia rosea]
MLDMDRSVGAIRAAAAEQRFISYGQIARASDVPWSMSVRSQMRPHLEGVCGKMLQDAGAMVSAIVVNQDNLATGTLDPQSLAGFADCARRLGFGIVEDREAFLREQQRLTFEWGARTASA